MNATTTRRPRALLLDDDPTVLRLLATALEARGFEVRAAADAQGGIQMLTDELLDLDVLVADADLPGRDGASLLDLVRRAGGERDLRIALLRSSPSPALRARLAALGADAVVDRALGHEAAADAVAALAAPSPARTLLGGAAPAVVRGARVVARGARSVLAAARPLAGAPA